MTQTLEKTKAPPKTREHAPERIVLPRATRALIAAQIARIDRVLEESREIGERIKRA
jgi:hypothetical protein